jgi:hypothetical protein
MKDATEIYDMGPGGPKFKPNYSALYTDAGGGTFTTGPFGLEGPEANLSGFNALGQPLGRKEFIDRIGESYGNWSDDLEDRYIQENITTLDASGNPVKGRDYVILNGNVVTAGELVKPGDRGRDVTAEVAARNAVTPGAGVSPPRYPAGGAFDRAITADTPGYGPEMFSTPSGTRPTQQGINWKAARDAAQAQAQWQANRSIQQQAHQARVAQAQAQAERLRQSRANMLGFGVQLGGMPSTQVDRPAQQALPLSMRTPKISQAKPGGRQPESTSNARQAAEANKRAQAKKQAAKREAARRSEDAKRSSQTAQRVAAASQAKKEKDKKAKDAWNKKKADASKSLEMSKKAMEEARKRKQAADIRKAVKGATLRRTPQGKWAGGL